MEVYGDGLAFGARLKWPFEVLQFGFIFQPLEVNIFYSTTSLNSVVGAELLPVWSELQTPGIKILCLDVIKMVCSLSNLHKKSYLALAFLIK